MLFEARFWPLIADGSVTVTFRRWRRRQVVAGRHYRTAAGIIEVETIDVVEPGAVTDADACRSGYPSAAAVLEALRGTEDLPIYRITFHAVAGPDPRAELAAGDRLSADDVDVLDRRLARLDAAAAHGPWTRAVLDAIAAQPTRRVPPTLRPRSAGSGSRSRPTCAS